VNKKAFYTGSGSLGDFIMKILIAMALTVLLLISLIAFNYEDDDPNHGVWKATKGEMLGVSMDVEDFFGEGFTIELKANGKCSLIVDGKKANGSWTLDNGILEIKGGGIDSNGSLENGKLTMKYVLGTSLTLVLEKE